MSTAGHDRTGGVQGCVWARGHVSEVEFSAKKLVDKVSGSGEACSLLWHMVAMEVLGLAVHGFGSGWFLLSLAWAAPDGISGVSGFCLTR